MDGALQTNLLHVTSGARTNLKVGGGHTSDANGRKKIFLVVPFHFSGSTRTISRFGERFRDGQHRLVSFLFAVLLLTVSSPIAQPFVKVGARRPPCPMARLSALP